MSNLIKIKRSQTTLTPPTLAEGELAYSELSKNLFIGVSGGNIQKIGGNADVVKLSTIQENANNYIHPSDGGGSLSNLAGASIISGITVNTAGHVTGTTTRNLTVSDIGAAPLNNPIFTGTVTLPGDPVNALHAATKQYVDSVATGLDVKASVRAATTANITLSGTQTIDGVALAIGNRVLVKNQTTASQNGIYVVASGAWTRALDADENFEVTPGMFTFVEQGTVNAATGWVLSTTGTITIGTTALTFSQFSGSGTYLAGNGLSLTGNTFNVGGTADRITVSSTAVDIASTYVGQSSITTLGTIGTGTWQGTIIAPQYGGTGVNNGTRTITLGGNFTTSGAFTTTLTVTGNTNVTLPTSGTLVNTAVTTLSSLSSVGTITTGTWSASTIAVNRGGTGVTTLTGIVKGNGTNAFSAAIAGTDYLDPNSNIDGGTF